MPEQSEDSTEPDPSLLPVPLGVELWVAALTRPLLASALLGLPFGLLAYGLDVAGFTSAFFAVTSDVPAEQVAALPPEVSLLGGWVGGAMAIYLLLSRPY